MIFHHPIMMKTPSSSKSSINTLPFRPLGETYGKNTFHYELVIRDGNYAIFKQRLRPGVGCLAYEVIRIRVAPEITIMGKVTPEREISPPNELFVIDGWSYPTLERAKIKFHELVKKRDGT